IASEGTGISELVEAIGEKLSEAQTGKSNALAEKAFQLIQKKRMVGISKKMLEQQVGEALQNGDFNLYRFVSQF
ncbi:MAG TPA: hypothetical protein VKR32_17985, partial [Puia sp.]|nr:hypothetical protein [Puia sp.]